MRTLAHYRRMRADALAASNLLRCDADGCGATVRTANALLLSHGTYCSQACVESTLDRADGSTYLARLHVA